MSKHFQKYPGLFAGAKAAGIRYETALMRVRHGWSIERAISTPVGKQGRTKEQQAATMAAWTLPVAAPPWERPGYASVIPKAVIRRQAHEVRKARGRYSPPVNDTSPPHIQKLRAAYCAQFIKFGTLDESIATKLREYAYECRSASRDLAGIPAEHAPRLRRRTPRDADDHGGRDDAQIGGETAQLIAEYLRT